MVSEIYSKCANMRSEMINEVLTYDFSARSYVVRTQGLDSEVTGQSEASMQDEGFTTPESTLAKGRCTTAPPKRPQDSAQTVSPNRLYH